jgi:hypothetical protein
MGHSHRTTGNTYRTALKTGYMLLSVMACFNLCRRSCSPSTQMHPMHMHSMHKLLNPCPYCCSLLHTGSTRRVLQALQHSPAVAATDAADAQATAVMFLALRAGMQRRRRRAL